MKYLFEYSDEVQLIIITASINSYEVRLALDTGASNTIIDTIVLILAGYRDTAVIDSIVLETASGKVTADVIEVAKFTALGDTLSPFCICAYDFLAHNLATEIDGILGLDFLMRKKICIDFSRREISFG